MKLKTKLDFDAYFQFIEEYFDLFKIKIKRRKFISGSQFKI
jgi:hypothetical protein